MSRHDDEVDRLPQIERRRERAQRSAFARRAIFAFMQDNNVSFNMVDDLDALVSKAIRIAERTKTINQAINAAGDVAEKERKAVAAEILACEDCRRARAQIGYPGMPSRMRYCEVHRD